MHYASILFSLIFAFNGLSVLFGARLQIESRSEELCEDETKNFALGKPTGYSIAAGLHGVSGGNANGIVDGVKRGSWRNCVHTSDWKTDPYVFIDLEAITNVGSVTFNMGPGYSVGWSVGGEIRVSSEPFASVAELRAKSSICKTVGDEMKNAGSYGEVTIECDEPVEGRYVTFLVPGDRKIVCICELEVHGACIPTTTEAPTIPAAEKTGSDCEDKNVLCQTEPSFILDILCQIDTVKEQCPKRCNSCPELVDTTEASTTTTTAMPKCERKYNGYYSYGDCGSQNGVKSFEECCELTKQRNATSSRNIIRFSWNGNSCAFKCGGKQDNRGGNWWSSAEDISTCTCQ